MNEPKYLLVYEQDKFSTHSNNYAIYEQAVIGGQIGQRIWMRFDTIEKALRELSTLNDNQPVLLAYTTKVIDNTFDLNRG